MDEGGDGASIMEVRGAPAGSCSCWVRDTRRRQGAGRLVVLMRRNFVLSCLVERAGDLGVAPIMEGLPKHSGPRLLLDNASRSRGRWAEKMLPTVTVHDTSGSYTKMRTPRVRFHLSLVCDGWPHEDVCMCSHGAMVHGSTVSRILDKDLLQRAAAFVLHQSHSPEASSGAARQSPSLSCFRASQNTLRVATRNWVLGYKISTRMKEAVKIRVRLDGQLYSVAHESQPFPRRYPRDDFRVFTFLSPPAHA